MLQSDLCLLSSETFFPFPDRFRGLAVEFRLALALTLGLFGLAASLELRYPRLLCPGLGFFSLFDGLILLSLLILLLESALLSQRQQVQAR